MPTPTKSILFMLCIMALLVNCSRWNVDLKDMVPQVTTGNNTTGNISVNVRAEVSDLGHNTLKEFGICYSATNSDPRLDNGGIKQIATGSSPANVLLSNLQPNTTYSYRTYAINNKDLIGYGSVLTFKTDEADPQPETLDVVGTPSSTSAQVQCRVANANTVTIQEYGVVFTVGSSTPTLNSGTKVAAVGNAAVATTVTLMGIQSLTTYRAYCISKTGNIFYGVPKSFSSASAASLKQWDKTFGGSLDETLISMIATPDGGYLLGGYSVSGQSGDRSESSRGDNDYWIVKTNAIGQKQWDKSFGGNSGDILTAMIVTPDGGYLLGGYSYSGASGDKTENGRGASGLTDMWLIKIDANGQKQWDKAYGGNANDYLYLITATSDGGYLLGGESGSGQSGDKTEASRGGTDFWLIKIDATGKKQWDKTYGGDGINDTMRSIITTPDGGYLIGGYSGSGQSGDRTESSRGGFDYWLVKINASGQKQWDKAFGGNSDDYLSSIGLTSDGGYLLGGFSQSGQSGEKTENTRGGFDYWVVKINATGQKQWDKSFGGSKTDYMYSIAATLDGGYLLAGASESGQSAERSVANRGTGFDYWLVKINASGQKQWDTVFGGSANDYIYPTIIPTADSGYLLGGYSESGQSGDKSENSRGGFDYWLVKIK